MLRLTVVSLGTRGIRMGVCGTGVMRGTNWESEDGFHRKFSTVMSPTPQLYYRPFECLPVQYPPWLCLATVAIKSIRDCANSSSIPH